MKVVSIVGARPQFVKLAPIAHALQERDAFEHSIVHTGQHYDQNMSATFFMDLDIPQPDLNLNIGSGTQGMQTGRMMEALDAALPELVPDLVLVYGDTNSTLAGALSAVKMHLPVVHLEAGLRSFNRRMPEEINRLAVDHVADLLLAPTATAFGHLEREGLASRTKVVGDVMADICMHTMNQVEVNCPVEVELLTRGVGSNFYLCTLHRAENTDDRARLELILGALKGLDLPVLLLAHPRLRQRARDHGLTLTGGSLISVDPVGYREMVALIMRAKGVVTDSGGLQKEARIARTACTTVRTETEWTETLDAGWNVLVQNLDRLAETVARETIAPPEDYPFGRGDAAEKSATALLEFADGRGVQPS